MSPRSHRLAILVSAVVVLAVSGGFSAGTVAASVPTGFPGPAATPQPAVGTPGYLQQAYGLTALSHAPITDTVAIVDNGDDSNAEADLGVYRAAYDLPACTAANGCFSKVAQDGSTNYPAQVANSGANIANDNEISIDLDAVSALCPNCHILLVEASPNSDGTGNSANLDTAQATAGHTAGVEQISDSWGSGTTTPPAGVPVAANPNGIGDPYVFPGIMTVAGSGDWGYWGDTQESCGTYPYNYLTTSSEYPAADPDVAAAGATTVTAAANERGFDEAPWNQTGSGCDFQVSQPSWQTTLMDASPLTWGCTGRAYNDLSADGDPATGLHVYNSSNPSGWIMGGGTSQAAPLIAAYYAVVGATGGNPSWAYARASLFNDITNNVPSGNTSNGRCLGTLAFLCNIGPGFDGPTGLGSISGDAVAGAPSIADPASVGYSGPDGNLFSTTLTGATIYPNAGTTLAAGGTVASGPYVLTGAPIGYYWEYGPGAATTTTDLLGWLSSATSASAYTQTSAGGTIDASTSPVLTVPADTLTGLYPNTPYHYRLVAYNNDSGEVGDGADNALTAVVAAPTVTATTAAVSAGTTTATLHGTVNPECLPTTYTFSYGTSTGNGTTTSDASLPDSSCTAGDATGDSAVAVSQAITGLQPDTTYDYVLTADNGVNGAPSTDTGSFTTSGAPAVAITTPASSTATTADVHYSVSGAVSTLTCTLDGSPVVPCTYPTVSVSGLSVGSHTFVVQAAGPSGANASASATWIVNPPLVIPPSPTVAITSPMPSTTGASVTILYSEAGDVTGTACTLNSQAVGCSTNAATLTGLANGHYTFDVTATGPGGSSAPASYSFTVAVAPAPTTPPTVSLITAPPTNSSSSTAAFGYSTANATSASCTLSRKAVACGLSSATLKGLIPGSHTFVVTVSGPGGSASASYAFTVRKAGARTVTIGAKPALNDAGNSATFTLTTTGTVTGGTCTLTNGRTTLSRACSHKRETVTFKNLSLGSHTFTVTVRGASGAAASASYKFNTTVPPTTGRTGRNSRETVRSVMTASADAPLVLKGTRASQKR